MDFDYVLGVGSGYMSDYYGGGIGNGNLGRFGDGTCGNGSGDGDGSPDFDDIDGEVESELAVLYGTNSFQAVIINSLCRMRT